ncbi:alpha/beta hydrolase [Patulibacter sp. SYSU D01012]|uniref:alpha/beta hydrolase n=1 Tax=Patulibacter sp. SYSU D01012 TaxID=2817381 RepID=UPI001B30C4DC|nr:alpha/beta hydrolase [Patulibacter sp. SYSU D01012]
MPLHPQAAAFLRETADAPPLDACTPEENRAALTQVVPLTGPAVPLPVVEDVALPTASGPVPVRVYRPSLAPGLPAIAHFHGGGWTVGDLDSHDTTCRDLAAGAEAVVVAVDYRRGPEDPFPAAYDDCLAVTDALLQDGAGLGVDPARVAVAGDSAGGNLAAVVALALRGVGAGLVHQALIYPATDLAGIGETASYREYAEGHFLTTRDMRYFRDSYLAGHDPADPRVSPLRAEDLSGLPPATVVTGERDPLRDEGEAYADRLRAAGVPAEVRRFAGQVHPFVLMAGMIDDAVEARRYLSARLRAAFAG